MSEVTPRDREEKLLAAIAEGTTGNLPTPRNRKEKLLKEIYDNGGTGGGGTGGVTPAQVKDILLANTDRALNGASSNPIANEALVDALADYVKSADLNIATSSSDGLMSKEHVSKLNNMQIKTYTSIESLGLSGTPTVNEIKLAMPLYSELLIEVNFLASKTDSEGNTLDNASCRIVKLNSDGRAWAEAHGKSDGKYYVMRLGKSGAPDDFTEVWEQIAMDSDIKSYLPLEGGQMNGELKLSFGNSVANGSYIPTSTTLENLCSELSLSSGCSGSVNLVNCTWNNVVIPAGWYNYLYIPHRTGGRNGAEKGDNHKHGTLLLFGMTSPMFSQCFRVAWELNKIASIEMILSASDGFSDTLLASRTGRLYVYSNTEGDVVTTNGRSAISATGAKSIIIKGTLGLPGSASANVYGGHMIISVEGKGSWLDNDAKDNWGLCEDPLTYITPCGNTVYIYYMAGTWAYNIHPTSFVTLANGNQYSITDSCGFFGVNHTEDNYRYFKLMLSIADTVLFNSSYDSLQLLNYRQLSEGVKSLYPSRAESANVTIKSNNLYYYLATEAMTEGKPTGGDAAILHAAWDNNAAYDKQLAFGDGGVQYRCQNKGTWGSWITLADSKNGLLIDGNNIATVTTTTDTMFSSANNNTSAAIGTHFGNASKNTLVQASQYLYLKSFMNISANQNIATASDEKVKDFSNNLETDYGSLIKIFDIIQPKSYKYKYSMLNSESIGFCAQEVEDAFKSENIDPSKYSVLNIQYKYMMSRGDTEEDFKYYTKFMEISYNDLYNLAILKIKDMEEKYTNKLNNLEERLSALEIKEV